MCGYGNRKFNKYEIDDYGNEYYEESGGQRERDPKNYMHKFTEDLDKKLTSLNKIEILNDKLELI